MSQDCHVQKAEDLFRFVEDRKALSMMLANLDDRVSHIKNGTTFMFKLMLIEVIRIIGFVFRSKLYNISN